MFERLGHVGLHPLLQLLRLLDHRGLLTDRQHAEASTRAADTLAKAQQAIALEHKKMLNEARGEIARLVVKTTEQVLAKKLSDADRSSYNEAATKELTAL